LIDKIDQLEKFYNALKATFLLIKKAYENTKKAVIKALFRDIPRFTRNVKKTVNVLGRILKLREVPRVLKFPKFPKLPRLGFSFADFYAKYKLALNNLKDKNGEFYDKAYSTALQQSAFEITDPNEDVIQRGLRKARNSLRQARAQFQAKQAIRNAAVERARNELIGNIRQTNTTVERERQNILKQHQNAKTAGQLSRQQIGSRKAYLSTTEASQLLRSSRVNTEIKNTYGDSPTGTITPDGRTVYTDRTNNKVYVLQTARDRITELASRTTTRVTANLGEVVSATNTVNNLFVSYGTVVGGLNSNVIKTELARNIVQEAQTVNQISQIAQQAPGPVALSSGTQQQEVSINQETKSITTVSRRLRPNDALTEVEALNRQRAEQLGYSGVVSADTIPPIIKQFNGQSIFEARLTISYASQSLVPATQVVEAPQIGTPTSFIRASAVVTPSGITSTGSSAPSDTVISGGDIVTDRPELSIFVRDILINRLESPDVPEQEKQRIRQLLGTGAEISSGQQLPADPQLDLSQEATRPNLTVETSGDTARLTYNAGRVANAEYSLDNGRTFTSVNPPARSGQIIINNLQNGVYAARVRGIRADGSLTAPSQPKAIVIRMSEPVIIRTEPRTSTSALVFFDDFINTNEVRIYQFTIRGDNSGWTDVIPEARGDRIGIFSPVAVYGLDVNRTYTIRIRAAYKDGTFGDPSNTATFTTFRTRSEGGEAIA